MTGQCACPENVDQLLMIEYPGFVENHDKALATLGGLPTIKRVNDSQKERLELKFRNLDPLAHGAFADKVSKKCLVLRIKKKKHKNADETEDFDLSVVGKIQTSFKFDTLAEFQWLPMQRTNLVERLKSGELEQGVTIKRTQESLNPEYVSILDETIPIKDPFDNTLKNFNPDAPLLVLPAVFSRFDTPREIHQPHPKFRSKEMRDEFERQQSLSIIGRTRKKRSTMSHLINFGDQIPTQPPEKLLKDRLLIASPQEKSLLPKLERCFQRQKVWSKAALCYDLNCATLDIKYILPLIAFHYLTGPFRTMWVAYGYDPHKDAASKIYQTLDFRAKNPNDQHEYSRRSIHQYQIPMRKNVDKVRNKSQIDLKTIISTTAATSITASTSRNINQTLESIDDPSFKTLTITEAMCKFRRDLVPGARQLSYQLKDIEIDDVQSLVHANDGREASECSDRDGWLPEGTIDKIRKIMNRTLSEMVDSLASQLEEVD